MKARKLNAAERKLMFRNRVRVSAALLSVGVVILVGRYVQMQIVDQAFYA